MKKAELINQINKLGSYLCVGLDTDIKKIPRHLLKVEDPVFAFNKEIIDHTSDYAVAYKLNIAFYESLGSSGWESLKKTIDYIPREKFTIADAKRGDIGNTAEMYARAFFETMNFDAVTLSPYMGKDSIEPFLGYKDKWAIVLGLTSNEGANDFQLNRLEDGRYLFEDVIEKSASWGSDENMMYVIGATKNEYFEVVRKVIPDHFLLVPGVGAQGGSLEEISKACLNKDGGLLVNSSRGIIYRSSEINFGEESGIAAAEVRNSMKEFLT